MPKIDHDTKERILAAAEKVFHANGFKGTRTSQIAEESGISRTMMHYYFNSKEALFQEVLRGTLGALLTHSQKLFAQNTSLDALIGNLVEVIAGVLEEKPGLASFVVNIMNESPDMVQFLAKNLPDTLPKQLDAVLAEAKKNGNVMEDITGEDLILNIYALCSIPYLGMTYIKIKENRSDEEMKAFLRQRKDKIKQIVLNGIRK